MAEVVLHVYNVTNQEVIGYLNVVTKDVGHVGGAFHGAVEVYGQEYTFGFTESGTGIYTDPPKGSDMHSYKESIPLGKTDKEVGQVLAIIDRMSKEWPGSGYDLLTRNCCHFSAAFVEELDVPGKVPSWLNRFAGIGGTARGLGQDVQSRALAANRSMKASNSPVTKIADEGKKLLGKIGAAFGKKK